MTDILAQKDAYLKEFEARVINIERKFLQVGGSFISDRYTYLPYIGLGFTYFTLIYILINRFKKIKYFLITMLIFQSIFCLIISK